MVYIGDYVRNQFNGYGKLTYQCGFVYQGEWQEGQRHGTGELRKSIGNTMISSSITYKGEWENNKFIKGEVADKKQGSTYTGRMEMWQKTGEGKISFNDSSYIGRFKQDKFDCKPEYAGEFTYPDKSVYTGGTLHGKRFSYGQMKFANGEVQQGFWEEDELIQGVIKRTDNSYYNGRHHRGQRSGDGLELMEKVAYEGDFFKDKEHGEGKLTFYKSELEKNYFEGPFENGCPLELPTLNLMSRNKMKTGHFKDKIKVGTAVFCMKTLNLLRGLITFHNGDQYRGELKDHQFHGEGTYTWKSAHKAFDDHSGRVGESD
jgi:hypothetical protein